jgi:hypothetical protein
MGKCADEQDRHRGDAGQQLRLVGFYGTASSHGVKHECRTAARQVMHFATKQWVGYDPEATHGATGGYWTHSAEDVVLRLIPTRRLVFPGSLATELRSGHWAAHHVLFAKRTSRAAGSGREQSQALVRPRTATAALPPYVATSDMTAPGPNRPLPAN